MNGNLFFREGQLFTFLDPKKIKPAIESVLFSENYFKQKNEEGYSVYGAYNDFKNWRNKGNLIRVNGIAFDFDTKDKKMALDSLQINLPPTLITETRNGIHPYWLFKSPIEVNDENRQQVINEVEDVISRMIDWTKGFGNKGDKTIDVSRVLKIPNYYDFNGETPFLIKIIKEEGALYTFEELKSKFISFQAPISFQSQRRSEYGLKNLFNFEPIDIHRHDTFLSLSADLINRAVNKKLPPSIWDEYCLGILRGAWEFKTNLDKTQRYVSWNEVMSEYADIKNKELATSSNNSLPKNWVISLDDLLKMPKPEGTSWLIDKLLPKRKITLLAGYGGSGKTTIVMDWILKSATDKKIYNQYEVKQPFYALFIDEESGIEVMQQTILGNFGIKQPLPFQLSCFSNINLYDDYTIDEIINFCKEKNIDLIVFDSMVAFLQGDENKQADCRRLFSRLNKFKQAGLTILVIHHFNKPGKESGNEKEENPIYRVRGASAIFNAVDCAFAVIKSEDFIKVVQVKSCRGEDAKSVVSFLLETNVNNGIFSFNYRSDDSKQRKIIDCCLLISELNFGEGLSVTGIIKQIKETTIDGRNLNEKVIRETAKEMIERKELVKTDKKVSGKDVYILTENEINPSKLFE